MIAIDLGSNTIRIAKYDCKTKKTLYSYEKIVKTAQDLVHTKEISKEAVNRIINAINEAKKEIEFENVKAITTQALREANNSKQVLDEIQNKTGIMFEVISSHQEAYFASLASEQTLKTQNKTMFLVDIGGGSTELIIKNKKEMISESFQVGIVTASQKYDGIDNLKYGLKNECKAFREFINFTNLSYKPDMFVASSGTPTTVAALKIGLDYRTYDPDKINGVVLELKDLDWCMDVLLKSSKSQKEKLVGVGRDDLIISGILIFREIFVMSGFSECVVVDSGVREGVAIDFCNQK